MPHKIPESQKRALKPASSLSSTSSFTLYSSQPKLENETPKCNISVESENAARVLENDQEQSSGSEKYPAVLTPQIRHESQQLDVAKCHDQIHSSAKESGEQGDKSKSVETTCDNADETLQISEPQMPEEIVAKQENATAHVSMLEKNVSQLDATENPSNASCVNLSNKSSRRKTKVDWTPELHKNFVQAAEQLGVDQAIPSRILELMKAEGLTRHNVASHLQKYRMQKKHIFPKDEDRRLLHPRDPNQMSYYPHKPIMAYHYNSAIPRVYPTWGQPASTNMQMWGVPSYPPWQASENWHWNKPPNQALHADAWGFPVTPQPLQGGYAPYPQTASGFQNQNIVDNGCGVPNNPVLLHNLGLTQFKIWDYQIVSGMSNAYISDIECNVAQDSSESRPAEEIVDKIMKEVMSKPWLPLPLGLKLPSTENVLAELSRQGICNIPPPNQRL